MIDQDALGLDRIYVQAKRYADNKVSAGDIRDFFGSLDRFKASKGLFVTTSGFSSAAKETAELWWSSYFGHLNRVLSCRFTLEGVG